ncbi:OmpA family protein [Lysobacter sp. cf310]|uniref:OmpA family protein n=1 Tax=Lysobacter sp. cf310 TaxID=1761790 RepID=UPI0020C8B025|nr:OmpA family protein [Lysobacter sp. cf310]
MTPSPGAVRPRGGEGHRRVRAGAMSAMFAGLALACACALAQTPSPVVATPAPAAASKPVVASGAVPDEATKQVVLNKLRALYGAAAVVDRIEVDGSLIAPPNWREHVGNVLSPSLQQVSQGELRIAGNAVTISGQVGNEAVRQQVASDLSTSLNSTYQVTNRLRAAKVNVLQATLANRIVEFESGSATLTSAGAAILDELVAAWSQVGNRPVQVVGHTDSAGGHEKNVALSYARASAVKAYLVSRGINASTVTAQGAGPDQPIADNATVEGRARNRRIEFRVL